jgi:hypothetical protein
LLIQDAAKEVFPPDLINSYDVSISIRNAHRNVLTYSNTQASFNVVEEISTNCDSTIMNLIWSNEKQGHDGALWKGEADV